MLPSIPSENSGGLEANRAARATERTPETVARAPQDADAGEVDRSRRVDGVELTRRGERLADARRRARDDDASGDAPQGGAPREEGRAVSRGSDQNEASAEGPTSREVAERSGVPLDELERPEPSAAAQAAAASAAESSVVTTDDLRELRDLQRSDRQVRVQENLQRQLAAEFVRGAPVYEFEEGPDGRRYAVGADSDFQLPNQASSDPRQAARDAASARQAALASAVSSPAEQAFAARAASAEARARAEITREVADSSEEARRRAAELYEESRERLAPASDAAPVEAPAPPDANSAA